MNKKLLFPAIAIALVGGGLFATTSFAQNADGSPKDTLVQRIAEKFGLSQSEVQAVFDEVHKEHVLEMEKKHEERLSALVSEGKITEEQEQLILQKYEELRSQKESMLSEFETMTPEERRSAMEAKRNELENWAKENGINPEYLNFHVKFKAGGGEGFHHVIVH